MIQVKGLTKIYKSRKSGTCVALDHIDFTLPDKGFIFVIGKSGSGKTTLLSLLGGLDNATAGEIVEDGRQICDFSLREQVYYRNSTIGFIFQDFHLIDNLTVFDNIMLSLQLQGGEDREKVLRAIRDAELEGYENRFPRELSGGQKQRAAIARALVKEPRILLADEPTGNLDSKTTAQILGLLKTLSQEKLVVIVSHNLNDASAYADEIIELADGKIVQHVKRNEAFDVHLRVEEDTLVIPSGEQFSEENLGEVAAEIACGNVRGVRQDTERFRPFKEREAALPSQPPALEKRHLKFRHTAKLAVKFSRRRWLRMIVYSVIFAALMVVLGLSQLIMNFDGGEVIAKEMSKRNLNSTTFIKDVNATYESVDTTHIVDVEEGDVRKFYDAGYTGKVYPLVNYALMLTRSSVSVHQERLMPRANPYDVAETAGVLITEESFLEKQFGSLEYAAISAKPQEYGVYITDFYADACMSKHPTVIHSYNDLLGKYAKFIKYGYGYINGIIKTGYRDRYKDLLSKLTDPDLSKEEQTKLSESEECIAFYDEICQFLDIAYTFDPDFIEHAVNSGIRQFCSTGISVFKCGDASYECKEMYFSCAAKDNKVPLKQNEILINYNLYNRMFGEAFGKTYTTSDMDTFEPQTVTLSYYAVCDENKSQKKYEATLTVAGLTNNGANFNVADNVFRDLQRAEMFTFGLYFDGAEHADLLYNVASEIGFIPHSAVAGSITTMTNAVNVFAEFFTLIFVVLCVSIFLLLVQFGVKNIKEKMQDIGILKALGSRERDLFVIFGFQTIAVGLITVMLYIAGSFLFIGLANQILVLSLAKLAKNTMVMNLSFLVVKWKYILYNCVLALLIIGASFLVPMLRLRRIKPTNVIKARE